jgi:hypothetical protein
MKPFRDGKQGYVCIHLAGTKYKLHRLVAVVFDVGGEGPQVNHKNGLRGDNRAENLEWCTASENIRHSIDVLGNKKTGGGHPGKVGERHHRSKPVEAIRVSTGEVRRFESAEQARLALGIPAGSIPRCCAGKYASSHGWRFAYVTPEGIKAP